MQIYNQDFGQICFAFDANCYRNHNYCNNFVPTPQMSQLEYFPLKNISLIVSGSVSSRSFHQTCANQSTTRVSRLMAKCALEFICSRGTFSIGEVSRPPRLIFSLQPLSHLFISVRIMYQSVALDKRPNRARR